MAKQKEKEMATNKDQGNPGENENENNDGIEFVDFSEMELAKRGRKPIVDEILLEAMKAMKKDQAIRINRMTIQSNGDPKDLKKDQAKISARIRNHAKMAGWEKTFVAFQNGVTPIVKRLA